MSEWLKKIFARFGSVEVPPPDLPETATANPVAPSVQDQRGRIKVELWVDPAMLVSAREVCLMVESDNPRASAEAKHAMAYARLQRIYPETALRDVALAIELGLRS